MTDYTEADDTAALTLTDIPSCVGEQGVGTRPSQGTSMVFRQEPSPLIKCRGGVAIRASRVNHSATRNRRLRLTTQDCCIPSDVASSVTANRATINCRQERIRHSAATRRATLWNSKLSLPLNFEGLRDHSRGRVDSSIPRFLPLCTKSAPESQIF